MTKRILSFLLLSTACFTAFCVKASEAAEKRGTLYFEVFLRHSLTGEKLKQQIAVQENSDFSVITTDQRGVRWTISGKLGVLHEGVIPVDLTVKYYVSEKQNETSKGSLKLKIDKEMPAGGGIHGVIIAPSIWTKPRE